MRRLILVRHAKSSWDDPSLDDRDRPLNARGMRDASRMGRFLAGKGLRPQMLITSPALRAVQTARLLAEAWHGLDCRMEPRLYEAGSREWMSVVASLSSRWEVVLMIGHQPGMADFASILLANAVAHHVPTCAAIVLDADIEDWALVGPGCSRLAGFYIPRALAFQPVNRF